MSAERKCPKCGSLAATVGMSTSTLMGWSSYYDKEGNYHDENPNIFTTNYTCSECGQNYSISTRGSHSELHWQEDDFNTAPALIDTSELLNGDLTVNGDDISHDIQALIPKDNITRFIVSGDFEIVLQDENKTYKVDFNKLIQLLIEEEVISTKEDRG